MRISISAKCQVDGLTVKGIKMRINSPTILEAADDYEN